MTKDEAIQKAKILKALIELQETSKILDTFIPAFKFRTYKKLDRNFLHGNFNIGGTVSGRMSSNKVNLQQLPSTGTKYAKSIKKCFKAPDGWLFVGADFSSLEDKISALTTKDSNKLKVYTEKYDGHCLRAYSYFKDQMPDIDPNSVESINSIATRYKSLRQHSKGATFALTYAGTWMTLVKNLGFDEKTAKQIETNYHELYKESDDWVQSRITQAMVDGYVSCAFGLKVRTPLLKRSVSSFMSQEAMAESRTAGNALGQSYNLLTNRAANEFMQRVEQSSYRLDIHPVAQIHDAIYLLIKDDPKVLMWVNQHLIDCMEWQELDEIKHDEVKLGAELSVFYPTWAEETTLPNKASLEQIQEIWNEIHKSE